MMATPPFTRNLLQALAGLTILATRIVPVAYGQTEAERYYPLAVGHQWDYQVVTNGKVTSQLSNIIAKVEILNGEKVFRLDCILDGKVVGREHLKHSAEGLSRATLNGIVYEPPIPLLKASPTPGQFWEHETKAGAETFIAKGVIGNFERISVPAGTFRALKVTITTVSQGVTDSSHFWFAPDRGLIQQTLNSSGTTVVLKLKKFTKGRTPPADATPAPTSIPMPPSAP